MSRTFETEVVPYISARTPMYMSGRRVDVTLHFLDGDEMSIEMHHDEILHLLAEDLDRHTILLATWSHDKDLRTRAAATRTALDLVLSDRDTGISLACFDGPRGLVDDALCRALMGGGGVDRAVTAWSAF